MVENEEDTEELDEEWKAREWAVIETIPFSN